MYGKGETLIYYADEIEKIKYLRNRIAKSIAASGSYPDRAMVENRLAQIDCKLSLFRYVPAKESKKLDVKYLNESFLNIYVDLLILHRLVYSFYSDKYESTRAYVETHLAELEETARKYERKSVFESTGSSLGKTIFYKGSGFEQTTKNQVSKINLGDIKVTPGANIFFFIEGRYFDPRDVSFELGSMTCTPYSINRDNIKIPGELERKTYDCDFPEDVSKNGMFAIGKDSFQPSASYDYVTYGGKNMLSINTNNKTQFKEKTPETAISLPKIPGKVSFYILGGTYANMSFDKQPEFANFKDNVITTLEDHHKISFQYKDTTTFDIITDGTIYATKKHGIVKDGQLLYPDSDDLNTFRVEEYKRGNTISMPLKVTIRQSGEFNPLVHMVAVKEFSGRYDDD